MPIVPWFAVACLLLATSPARPGAAIRVPAQSAPAAAEPAPLKIGPVTFSGYAQFDGVFPIGTHDAAATGTFRVRRARVYARGDLTRGIGWMLNVDAAASPILRDAYLVFHQARYANVRVGQFITPFSLERLTSTSRLEAIDRLYERFTPSRDIGAMVFSAEPLWRRLSYGAAIVNGTGQNAHDNNDAKDLVGRLEWAVTELPGLSVGVNATSGTQPTGKRSRWGADANFARRDYRIAAEYLHETRNGWAEPAGHAFYVLAVRRLRPAVPRPDFHMAEIVVRVASSRDAALLPFDVRLAGRREIQLGFNYYFSPNVRILAHGWMPTDRPAGTPRATFVTRAQLMF
jgi:phosphate-selective porin